MRAPGPLWLLLLLLLGLICWGCAWPERTPQEEEELRAGLQQKRGSFVRLGRSQSKRIPPPSVFQDQQLRHQQADLQQQQQQQPYLHEELTRPFGQLRQPTFFRRPSRPSFLRLGRQLFDRMNRASSIRLGRRGIDTSLPSSYKRYRIRLKRST